MQAATNLRDIIRGFTALAKMQAGNRPEFQRMMPDIQLGGEGKVVEVSFAVTTDMLDAMRRGEGRGGRDQEEHAESRTEVGLARADPDGQAAREEREALRAAVRVSGATDSRRRP